MKNKIINEKGVKFTRHNTKVGLDAYSMFGWKRVDVVQKSWRDGSVTFAQYGVEFPEHWSENAINIVTSKYFRGAINTPERENSLKDVIKRVVDAYTKEGIKHKYFYSNEDAEIFSQEMIYFLASQAFAFNSPVWFNVGTKSPWQVSACYILAVEDKMEDILDWYKEEGLIFKGGSGAGINLSNLRSAKELLSSGGRASGPVSFMRGADASAGTIKSGGATRRAAKMVILDVDHPDIVEFVETKVREEEKIKTLRDAGFDMDLGGKDMISVQYQNANNSVRVNDEFMKAVASKKSYDLIGRGHREVIESVNAEELLDKIAEAAWACADPGIQYDNEIQRWHTLPNEGRISATNPCSEFVHLDNSSCNLASIRLTAFYRNEDKSFDIDGYLYLTRLLMVAAEISVAFGHFPTAKIGEVTKKSRPIGLGYTDLGALLMLLGVAYDSDEGRAIAASITGLLTAQAYRTSTELAQAVGSFEYYEANKLPMQGVMELHEEAGQTLVKLVEKSNFRQLNNLVTISQRQADIFKENLTLGQNNGYRNSQVTVLAPTGTISFFMDSTTTGVEPEFSLVKTKKVADGTSIKIANKEVTAALINLGYQKDEILAIEKSLVESGNIYNAKELREKDYAVFSCAIGENAIKPMGHVKMMAAIQPFISGAISKTVNLPETATVADVKEIYLEGWKLGLKAIAIYRDNCKVGQPLSSTAKPTTTTQDVVATSNHQEVDLFGKPHPFRVRLPHQRKALTTSFNVGGAEGYLTAGSFTDGQLGEVFLKMSKQGSTLAGVMDAFAISVSIGLQYGVPLETFVEKFTNSRFEPSGLTNDKEIRMASSVMDYVFRRLALDFLSEEERASLGILTNEERITYLNQEVVLPTKEFSQEKSLNKASEVKSSIKNDAPLCFSCGVQMQRSGSCHVCPNCGGTSGCS